MLFMEITSVVVLISLAVMVPVLMWYRRQALFALEPLFQQWGNQTKFKLANACTCLIAKDHDHPFAIGYTPPQRATPPRLYLTLAIPQRVTVAFRKRTSADRLCSALKWAGTLDLNDSSFTDFVQVGAADSHAAMEVLCDARIREAIRRLLTTNQVSHLWMNRRGIALIANLERGQRIETKQALSLMDALKSLSQRDLSTGDESLRRVPAVQIHPTEPLFLRLGWPLGLMLFAGAASWLIGVEVFPPLYPVLNDVIGRFGMHMAAGMVLTLTGLWALTHRRTDRHIYLSVLGALCVLSWFTFGCGSIYFLNGFLDRATPAIIEKAEVAKLFTKGRGGRKVTFYVHGRETGAIDRPAGRIEQGAVFRLHIKPGRFGYEWIAEMSHVSR